jgi:CDP-glucose 4,6-dehydratase
MTDQETSIAGRSAFVTGASGIIGSWLVKDLLAQGAIVVALLRDEPPESELIRSGQVERVARVRGGLEDLRLLQRTLAEYEVDVVFHLGAQTQVRTADRDPLGTLEANVRGTYNLLEAMRTTRPRTPAVIASSDKAYGHADDLPYTEAHALAGRGIYEASKSAADLLAASYARTFKLPIAIARCGNVYGGGDLNWDRIVPGTIRSLLRGERPLLRSDGRPRRDYLYVRDAVSAYLRLAQSLSAGVAWGEAFNFGHGTGVSVNEVVAALEAIIGRTDLRPIVRIDDELEIRDQWLDASKARDRLGWVPSYGLADGLRETVDWYRELLAA